MAKTGFFIALICILASCVKDEKIEPQLVVPASLRFNFQAKVKEENLVPGSRMYTNYSKDSFSVTKFSYYISNIRLTNEDGQIYFEPESYHLIEHAGGKTSFGLDSIPPGNYIKIEFLIGVDSLRNVSGARVGALDPANDMFWDWKQGYVFLKLEGIYNTQTQSQRGDYGIHIGGFKGPNSCLQKCEFYLTKPLLVQNGKQTSVFYRVQVDEIFVKPAVIGFDYYYENVVKGDAIFRKVSENYMDMFVLDRIVN